MADETLTLALHGEVSLEAFADAISRWRRLVDALTNETVPGHRIRWVIDDLVAGSATATIRADAEQGVAAPVVEAYDEVGEALAKGSAQLLTPTVRVEAVALTSLINGEVDYIRFETAKHDRIVTLNYDALLEQALGLDPSPVELPAALGGVQGRIQTLTSRGALRFTLYDVLHDRAVSCYLREGQEEIMRDVWGQTATVEGVVTREPTSGRPLNIRQVRNVSPVRVVDRDAYLNARGAVRLGVGDTRKPEELVAAARDE